MSLSEALAHAYHLEQVYRDRAKAVEHLRSAIGDDHDMAHQELKRLSDLVDARSLVGQCGCYVSETMHRLLRHALNTG